jgi:hypothetical protein
MTVPPQRLGDSGHGYGQRHRRRADGRPAAGHPAGDRELTAGGTGAGVQLTVNGAAPPAILIRFGRIQIG